MCLSNGTPKIINFPFVPNGKFIIFRCPEIWTHYNLIEMCLNIGTPNNHHFPFGTNGKIVVFGVPILKHTRVYCLFATLVYGSGGDPIAQWVKRWPTGLADQVRSPLEEKSPQQAGPGRAIGRAPDS